MFSSEPTPVKTLHAARSATHRAGALIVVEDRLIGKNLAQMLTAIGFARVRVVRRAASALFLAHQFPPGVAFLDIDLLDDAYHLASALRRLVGDGGLRLIALAHSVEQSLHEARSESTFEGCLVNPVARKELDALM